MVINYRIAAAAIVRDARDTAEAKAHLRKGILREIKTRTKIHDRARTIHQIVFVKDLVFLL